MRATFWQWRKAFRRLFPWEDAERLRDEGLTFVEIAERLHRAESWSERYLANHVRDYVKVATELDMLRAEIGADGVTRYYASESRYWAGKMDWLFAFRDLFTPGKFSANDFARRLRPLSPDAKVMPNPEEGLTFDEVIEWLDLPKPLRRPKRVRASLDRARAFGMIRVVDGRYLANELLFYGGPPKDKLIDPRPLVRRAEDECSSCGGHLSSRLGCYLCEGCGLRIEKREVRFICQRCGRFQRGYQGPGESVTANDARCGGSNTRRCVGVVTSEIPKRSPEITGHYEQQSDGITCPHCSFSQHGSVAPDADGLVWCCWSSCKLPFYVP